MSAQPHEVVDRCVDFVLSFLRSDARRKEMTPERQQAEHDKALDYLNRLHRDTLRSALHRLYELGENQARRRAAINQRLNLPRRR